MAAALTAELHKLTVETETIRDFDDFSEKEKKPQENWLMNQQQQAMRMSEWEARASRPAVIRRTDPPAPYPASPNYTRNIPPGQFFPAPGPVQGGPGFNPGAAPEPAQPRRKGPTRGPYRQTADFEKLQWAEGIIRQMTPSELEEFNSLGPKTAEQRYLQKQGAAPPSWKFDLAQIKYKELSKEEQRTYPGGWEEWLQKNPFADESMFLEPFDARVIPQPRGPRFGAVDNYDGTKSGRDDASRSTYTEPALPPQFRKQPEGSFNDLMLLITMELFPTGRMHYNYPVIYKQVSDRAPEPSDYKMYPVMHALDVVFKVAPMILKDPLEVFVKDLADMLDQGPGNAKLAGWQFNKLRGTLPAVTPGQPGPSVDPDDPENKRTYNPNRTKLLIMAVILLEKVAMLYRNRTVQDRFYKIWGARETRDMVVARLREANKLPEWAPYTGADSEARKRKMLPPQTPAWRAYRKTAMALNKFEARARDLIFMWENDTVGIPTEGTSFVTQERNLVLKVRRGPKYLAYFTREWKAWFYVEIDPPEGMRGGWDDILVANPIGVETVARGEVWPRSAPSNVQAKALQLGDLAANNSYSEAKMAQWDLEAQMDDVAGDASPGEAGFGGERGEYEQGQDQIEEAGLDYDDEGREAGEYDEADDLDGGELPGVNSD